MDLQLRVMRLFRIQDAIPHRFWQPELIALGEPVGMPLQTQQHSCIRCREFLLAMEWCLYSREYDRRQLKQLQILPLHEHYKE